jgi:hypothetical protein
VGFEHTIPMLERAEMVLALDILVTVIGYKWKYNTEKNIKYRFKEIRPNKVSSVKVTTLNDRETAVSL